jgi:UDP-N-acetyl-D-glucosamine dehydrogenase
VERKPEFFADKGIKIGIIGCGYVGLPLALRFADVGQRVTGFDLDHSKIEKLNVGQSYIQHIPSEKIKAHVDAKKFDATSDFARLRDMDAILICVPTPLDERREPDLSYVENTARAIAPNLQRNQLIALESITYPGSTEELVLPILEEGGLRCPIAHCLPIDSQATIASSSPPITPAMTMTPSLATRSSSLTRATPPAA